MSIDEYMHMLARKQRRLKCPWYDIRVCCSPWWHRKYWYHAGGQRYICEVCERIAV